MKYNIFIDGAEGTTGLKIHEYFKKRDDINVISIEQEKRKVPEARLACMKQADASFLCLPDAASKEIAGLAPKDLILIDTSTAHRVDDEWVYGLPELEPGQREKIKSSTRIANPGCHATGTIVLIKPLIASGLISPDYPFSAFSLTGYSGGGKKMIADYDAREEELKAPRQYGIAQHHKHLPEIVKMTGISKAPAFMPVVADYFSGMQVTVPVAGNLVKTDKSPKEALTELFKEYYAGEKLVGYCDEADTGGFIHADRLALTNRLDITVEGNDDNILLVATFDNLGKGASGAAIQNMNIVLGIEEEKGLL